MIVDDDEVLQHTVRSALFDLDVEPLSLVHPSRLLAVALEQQPDLLLVNIEIAHHAGNLIEELEHESRTRGTPVLMYSRKDTPYDRLLAFELGAGYLGKPFETEALARRIAEQLWSGPPMPSHAQADTMPDLLEIDRQQAELLRQAERGRDPAQVLRTASRPAPRPVLIVEDDADIRTSLSHLLEDEGIPTLTASNGQEALDVLRLVRATPSVVLLDLMMPVMDGWEFRRRLEADRTAPAPKVVIMSAMSPDETIGSAVWLRKPLGIEQLLSTVTELAGS
jgi:DNA-binding response OmpR family regulator